MRLIDADKLMRDIEHYHLSDGKFQHWVEIQNTVEPEQKKGKWIFIEPNGFKCSECNRYLNIACGDVRMNFCPNCGVHMRGDSDDQR